ncbi:MAG TPA: TetR/AcrR family transcriptional regulator [Jatrophihabitans sp.]|jgi:AcrR family transcriptional regulator|uniref:TetR/AcrR family transcriptional regulator n=1 Tax=Jatrophihabitans sp. TaxID=1932789 RepID=UPI002DF75C89|nr:TetR/AcrR family transcriptional regulator [Jatrophihabitans sp.]
MSPRSAARQRILDTADRLFYDEGIRAVGIHRIVEEAGVTRVTLYRHFPSKDDLISTYLENRAQYDRDQVNGLVARHADNPRQALVELATVLTDDDFAAMQRGCPFINSSAEFTGAHVAREHSRTHRAWVTSVLEELLTRIGHPAPRSAAHQLMMVRTGAVVSRALDRNPELSADFLAGWNLIIDGSVSA